MLGRQALGDMPRILLMSDGDALAHTTRILELALELRKDAKVAVGLAGKFESIPEHHGIMRFDIPALGAERVREVDLACKANYYTDQSLARSVEDELELYSRWRPDVVVSDFRASCNISTAISGVLHATVLNASWTHFGSLRTGVPACHPAVSTPSRMAGLLGPGASSLARRAIQWTLAPLVPWLEGMELRSANVPFRLAQERHGLPPTSDLFETWASADLVIIADEPGFVGLHSNAPSHFFVAGAIPWKAGPFAPPPDTSLPFVYLTAGSSGADKSSDILRDAIRRAGLNVIETQASPFVADHQMLDGSLMMRSAATFICHGGSGTIYQAIEANRYGLFVPAQHDQEWNARHAVARGLGECVFPREATAEGVARRLRYAVDKNDRLPSKEHVACLGGGATRAAQRILSLVVS